MISDRWNSNRIIPLPSRRLVSISHAHSPKEIRCHSSFLPERRTDTGLRSGLRWSGLWARMRGEVRSRPSYRLGR